MLIILAILILIAIVVVILINYFNDKKLEKCLEPTGRPVHTGLKSIDDCYHDCCQKSGEQRTACFDVCYSID